MKLPSHPLDGDEKYLGEEENFQEDTQKVMQEIEQQVHVEWVPPKGLLR
jgi:hypothetical protein